MSDKILKQATLNLKKAVPLMMKHQIPATPNNYALWYLYVEDQNPQLTAAIDEIISEYDTVPTTSSEVLYQNHIASQDELDMKSMRLSLEAMATELSQTMSDTGSDTSAFQSSIDKNFAKLNRIEEDSIPLEQVLGLVKNLVEDASSIRKSTDFFNSQLSKAQLEIAKLKNQLKETEKDALYDALTGALNRRAFDADLKDILDSQPEGLCIILADIDHFKAFNDNYGHMLGDQVLKVVAKRMNEACRDGAKVYRVGGEEFAIICSKSNLRSARHLAESVRRAIEKLSLKDRRSNQRIDNITSSFGVAEFNPVSRSRAIFDAADSQLYEAKRLGRNRVMPIIS
ncbi:GGDEF domain-containing protein [Agarivorans sp. MS3-6]|uniref:GGDEF domain-containing protein n=1 Tax=Agarivorans sp. TSD2052 TaxID=2937286 RepID=UPI00200D9169|nr:GGDEF domain-containing protein [Agarivorans sp. TSD2052]UPW18741.1 GGDEF domain-containing protein [Agarivorans sp. TSD2052]